MLGGQLRARRIIEKTTGEILADEDEGDRVKITYMKESSINAFKKKLESDTERKINELSTGNYEMWNLEVFYKGNIKEIQAIMRELNVYEKAFLYSIVPYIGYDDCCLKYNNGNELSFEKMVEISGISKGKLSETIKSLIDKDILYKGKNSKNTQYFVNPWLFCKGNRINKVLKTMFKNYKIRTLGVRWREL